jgi:hypothetical protein
VKSFYILFHVLISDVVPLNLVLCDTGSTKEKDGELTMGDKSPKANKKQATQKQTKSNADQQKKKDFEAAKAKK